LRGGPEVATKTVTGKLVQLAGADCVQVGPPVNTTRRLWTHRES